MEKIKEALAKAKQYTKSKPQESRLDLASKVQVVKNSFDDTENELGNIAYQNTTVVKLDARHLEKNRIVSHIKNNAITGLFDTLRTQVLQKMEENNWRTLAVVSPTPGSGKTLTSINLAISIAQQPHKTAVLVDFDLRRPRVANYLGIHTEKSLNDFLSGKAELSEVMVNPGIPRLVILPTQKPVSRSAETLSSSLVANLIKDLKERYKSRVVIFDLPPMLNSDDAMVILPQIDCILMVVSSGMSTETEIEETLHHLPKESLLGVILNRADTQEKTYYY